MWLINCVDIETSSSYRQCHQVIDEKISDKIIVSDDESESRDYSAQRSSDSLITLIYWESLSSSSLLDIKSYIYLCEKLRAHENDQNAFFTIDQSHALNDCDCTFILTIYSTSTWHKSNQEKKRIIQYNHTLSLHHAHLSFITYFSTQWMTIIEQENIVFNITITSITSAKKSSLTFMIEDRRSKHHCIEYHQWRVKQRRCIIIKQYRHSSRVYLSIMRWIEAINSLLITLFQIHCFNDVKSSCSQQAIFFLREFCSFNTHSIVFLMSWI